MIARVEAWIEEVRTDREREAEEEEVRTSTAWDDVRGGELKIEDVQKARREEVEYMERRGLWERVPVEECWRRTGKAPIGTRWAPGGPPAAPLDTA